MTEISDILENQAFIQLVDCKERIKQWLSDSSIDGESKAEILSLIDVRNVPELRDRFYRELEFGTGGMRGVIGAGNNRINKYVIRRSTQGLANYIRAQGSKAMNRGVAIAYDSRRFSEVFAKEAASVLAGNGITVHLFKTLSTTPSLSFAVRHLGCISGICVTASHNPPQYNGYKVYWDDGAQIVPPVDQGILNEVFKIHSFSEAKIINFNDGIKKNLIHYINDEVLNSYYEAVSNLQLWKNISRDVKIVYTPLHGTGAVPVKEALTRWGYRDFEIVPEQEKPDGNFPTVKKPNPEEADALKMAVALAEKNKADIVVATDPDSDRLAIVVRDPIAAQGIFAHQAMSPNYVFLNGNQTGALMIDNILASLSSQSRLKPTHKIVKTIVTSELHTLICKKYKVESFSTLTGFKWIASLVREWETTGKTDHDYLFGTEESFGYMPGPYVRDKDGVGALCQAVEMVSLQKSQKRTLCDHLLELFAEHGAWQEDLINVDLVGEEGAARIKRMMDSMRESPYTDFDGVTVAKMFDYKTKEIFAFNSDKVKVKTNEQLKLPVSDVLQFELEDGSRISMRPSGTEPKIKFYLSVCTKDNDVKNAYKTSLSRVNKLKEVILKFVDSIK